MNTLSDDPDTQSNSSFFNNSAPKNPTVYLGGGNAKNRGFKKIFSKIVIIFPGPFVL